MNRIPFIVLMLAGPVSAATLHLRIVSDDAANCIAMPDDQVPVHVFIQARLDGGAAPTTDGLAEWSATLRLSGSDCTPLPNICDTNAFDLVEADFSGRSSSATRLVGMGAGARELTVLDCDSNAGTIEIAGGPFHEGDITLGVGNGPGWTTLAEGFLVVSSTCPYDELLLAPEAVTAATIDPGQPGPPYQTTPVSGGIDTVELHLSDGCCARTDVNCDGFTNATDIGLVGGGANFQRMPPHCDRTDVNTDGFTNATTLASSETGRTSTRTRPGRVSA